MQDQQFFIFFSLLKSSALHWELWPQRAFCACSDTDIRLKLKPISSWSLRTMFIFSSLLGNTLSIFLHMFLKRWQFEVHSRKYAKQTSRFNICHCSITVPSCQDILHIAYKQRHSSCCNVRLDYLNTWSNDQNRTKESSGLSVVPVDLLIAQATLLECNYHKNESTAQINGGGQCTWVCRGDGAWTSAMVMLKSLIVFLTFCPPDIDMNSPELFLRCLPALKWMLYLDTVLLCKITVLVRASCCAESVWNCSLQHQSYFL